MPAAGNLVVLTDDAGRSCAAIVLGVSQAMGSERQPRLDLLVCCEDLDRHGPERAATLELQAIEFGPSPGQWRYYPAGGFDLSLSFAPVGPPLDERSVRITRTLPTGTTAYTSRAAPRTDAMPELVAADAVPSSRTYATAAELAEPAASPVNPLVRVARWVRDRLGA